MSRIPQQTKLYLQTYTCNAVHSIMNWYLELSYRYKLAMSWCLAVYLGLVGKDRRLYKLSVHFHLRLLVTYLVVYCNNNISAFYTRLTAVALVGYSKSGYTEVQMSCLCHTHILAHKERLSKNILYASVCENLETQPM